MAAYFNRCAVPILPTFSTFLCSREPETTNGRKCNSFSNTVYMYRRIDFVKQKPLKVGWGLHAGG